MTLRILLPLISLILFTEAWIQDGVAQPNTTKLAVQTIEAREPQTPKTRQKMGELVVAVNAVSQDIRRLQAMIGSEGVGSTIVRIEVRRKSDELRNAIASLITTIEYARELGINTKAEMQLVNELLAVSCS